VSSKPGAGQSSPFDISRTFREIFFLENNFVVHFIVRNFSGVDCTSRRTRRAFDGHLTE